MCFSIDRLLPATDPDTQLTKKNTVFSCFVSNFWWIHEPSSTTIIHTFNYRENYSRISLYASEVKMQRRCLSLWRKRTFVKVATPTVSQTVCCQSLHRVLLVVDLIHLCFEVKQIQRMTCISASTYFQQWPLRSLRTWLTGSIHCVLEAFIFKNALVLGKGKDSVAVWQPKSELKDAKFVIRVDILRPSLWLSSYFIAKSREALVHSLLKWEWNFIVCLHVQSMIPGIIYTVHPT